MSWIGGGVHVRVLLDRGDQRADAAGRVRDLVHQLLGLEGVGEPAQRPFPLVADGHDHAVEPVDVEPGRGEDRREVAGPSDAELLEPVEQRVLEVGLLQRGQRRPLARRPVDHLLLQLDQQLQHVRRDATLGDHRQLAAHVRHPPAQLRRGPRCRRGRVVQLVAEVGRQRAEPGEVLALADGALAVADAEVQAVQQVHGHREVVVHELREVGRADAEKAGRLGRLQRGGVARVLLVDVGPGRAGVGAAVVGLDDDDVLGAGPPAQPQGTVEQDDEVLGRLALAEDPLPGVEGAPLAALGMNSSCSSLSASNRKSVFSSSTGTVFTSPPAGSGGSG